MIFFEKNLTSKTNKATNNKQSRTVATLIPRYNKLFAPCSTRLKKLGQKAGLNKAILGSVLGKIRIFVEYKAKKSHKYVIYVDPKHTSQECAACGHIHPDNRKTQSEFECLRCGNVDNADRNAAKVIAKRARKKLLDLGMGLTLSETIEIIASGDVRKTSRGRKKSTTKQSSKPSADHVSEGRKTKISSNLLDLGNLGLQP